LERVVGGRGVGALVLAYLLTVAVRWPDDEHDTIEAADVGELRTWFEANHDSADGAWIWFWKVGSSRATVSWSAMVDVLLCFGWIDTKIQPIDADSYVQYVTHRRVGSVWSKVNKAKLIELEAAGLMTDAGRVVVERAQADGSWTLLEAAEAQIVPDDLAAALDATAGARAFYDTLSASQQSSVLRKIYLAKRDETRAKWVGISVEQLAARVKPPY
jgi:uncharacterized protein YdeI (YjbR/CyaY-like superfamily)